MAARPATKALVRPPAETRRPSTTSSAPSGSRSASSANSGSSSSPVGQVEDALDPGLGGAGPDDLRPRLAAHQQVERVGEHGLAGAGLAGDRVQPLPEPQLGPLDQQQVLDPQLTQHAFCVATARRTDSADFRARPPIA